MNHNISRERGINLARLIERKPRDYSAVTACRIGPGYAHDYRTDTLICSAYLGMDTETQFGAHCGPIAVSIKRFSVDQCAESLAEANRIADIVAAQV